MVTIRLLTAATLLAAVNHTGANDFSWGYFPSPIIPEDNPLTEAKVTLGKRLFNDTALSVNNTYSCASCHQPERHFTDGLALAVGATGETHQRNTPTLYNVAFNSSFGWVDLGITTLEEQHKVPLLNTTPIEMGFNTTSIENLAAEPSYQEAFGLAFNEGGIKLENIAKALASYVRTISAPASAFDDYLFHDNRAALSKSAVAGMDLFFSSRLACADCHASLSFSGPIAHSVQRAEPVFHVTAVGNSGQAFRAPTLRMIQHTGPYMHDGSLKTLEQVVEHYQRIEVERVPNFTLTTVEQEQLVAFLRAL